MVNSALDQSAGSNSADVIEIFSSAQGEGIYVGTRQTFVRFASCNLSCEYCDTFKESPKECKLECEPGSGNFELRPNPLIAADIMSVIDRLTPDSGTVSLTGGEPLLQAALLNRLLPQLKVRGYCTYLETNGTLHEEVKQLVPYLDIVAMDFKLPSAGGEADLFDTHRQFLENAKDIDIFVKAVVTADTIESDVLRCADIIALVNPLIPLVLQPVTPLGNNCQPPAYQYLLKLQSVCYEKLQDVRIIPQCHRMVGLP